MEDIWSPFVKNTWCTLTNTKIVILRSYFCVLYFQVCQTVEVDLKFFAEIERETFDFFIFVISRYMSLTAAQKNDSVSVFVH